MQPAMMMCRNLMVAICFLGATAGGKAADYCDDKIEPGESVDGKAMTAVSAVARSYLAERYCGAPPIPMTSVLVVVEEWHGCGPRDVLEVKAKAMAENFGQLDLGLLLEQDPSATEAERERQAKELVANIGGCEVLLKDHQEILKRYQNPPKWPREPEAK